MASANLIPRICAVLMLALLCPATMGAEYTQTRIGEVHSVDLATRTAIISGYRYSFAGTENVPPVVRMLGSEFGSFELLRPGMRVRVVYRLGQVARVVVELNEVDADTPLGVPDVEEA